MKPHLRIVTIVFVGLLVLLIVGCDRDADDGNGDDMVEAVDGTPGVDIPDAKLRAQIASQLGIQDDALITTADMLKLTWFLSLRPSGHRIVNLTGLEYAKNLESLTITDHAIVDVSPLKGLTTLEMLWIANNPLSRDSINIHIPAIEANGTFVHH